MLKIFWKIHADLITEKTMIPVVAKFLLSKSFLANNANPWTLIPFKSRAKFTLVRHRTQTY